MKATDASLPAIADTVPRDPLIGTTLDGRFEVKRLLGRGGMGAVYLASQPSVGREVALKVLHGHFLGDEVLVKRFEREIRLCAQLNHPNVVTVHDAGVSNGLLFMAMERLSGQSIAQLLDTGPVPAPRAVHLAAQVCEALSAAHERGIIHRDIKPSNVMVLDEPVGRDLVKVLDFGIASVQEGERLTKTHGVMGSPNAIAPEVIRNATSVSPKADLYAVGTLLFEMLTGQPPFGVDTPNAVFMRQVATTPPSVPATFPAGLVALVAELIDPEPSRRPESALVVRDRLLAPQTLRPVTAPAQTASRETTVLDAAPPQVPSSRAPLLVAAVLAVGALGAGVFALGGRSDDGRGPPPPTPTVTRPQEPPVIQPPVAAPSVEDAGVEAPVDAGSAPPPKRTPPRTKKKSDYEE